MRQERLGQGMEATVLSESDEIVDLMPIAPPQHPPAAKPTIGTQDDPNGRPSLSEPLDQQRQERPGVLGTIDITGPEITDQQLLPTKDRQRQKAIVIIIAMEK